MDLVYPLGTGSVWDNNELRYSLRSVAENVKDLRNVWVVGERPEWLTNVRYLPVKDMFDRPTKNTFFKLQAVCKEPDLSDDFLYLNDDFFILKPTLAADFPYFYKGVLPSTIRKSRMMAIESPVNTVNYLQFHNLTLLDYRVHCPIRFNKQKILDLPVGENEFGVVNTRAVYGNYYKVGGIEHDENFFPVHGTPVELHKWSDSHDWASILSLTARQWGFRKFMAERFPNPSQFEK